jgi:hypothetical protein
MACSMSESSGPERRKRDTERRRIKEDRRNGERVADDPLPRRDPERADRRKAD